MEIKLNLIPPYRKEEIDQSKRLGLVIRIGLAIFSIFVLFFSFLFGLYKVQEITLSSIVDSQESGADTEKYQKLSSFDQEFGKINSQMSQVMLLKNDQLYWSNLFYRLSDLTTEGVEITELATKNYSISLVGKATNRESLLSFKGKLEGDGCFSSINLPLSSLVSKDNVDFQMDFNIQEECLRKK
jgi:hypothetical protein